MKKLKVWMVVEMELHPLGDPDVATDAIAGSVTDVLYEDGDVVDVKVTSTEVVE